MTSPAKPRGALVDCSCDHCQRMFKARKSDRDRGWAKCCSKACASASREAKRMRQVLPLGRPGVIDQRGPVPVHLQRGEVMRTPREEFEFGGAGDFPDEDF